MASARRPAARRASLFLVGLLVVAEVQVLILLFGSQAAFRERWVADLRTGFPGVRSELEVALLQDGPAASAAAARRLLAPSIAAWVLDAQGRVLARDPATDASEAVPLPASLPRWPASGVTVIGPTSELPPRLVVAAGFQRLGRPVYLCLVRDGTALARELADHRVILLVHGVCLLLTLALGIAAALAGRVDSDGIGADGGALGAYEEAMFRLRRRDDELSRVHAEQLRHLRETIRDREAMARAGELTAGIVHEVRNGLGTIAGYARLIERAVEPTGPAAEMFRGLSDELRTLETVIQRIVEFVRSDELRPSDVDLRRLLERVAAREMRTRPGAATEVDVPEGLLLTADEDLLERAFENLIRNARDAAGPEGTVQVRADDQGADICVRIQDDGPGLPPQLADGPRVFATTKPGGLGLGLPTALKILALHGGRLTLQPRQPAGLVARVELPRRPLAGELLSVSPPVGQVPGAGGQNTG